MACYMWIACYMGIACYMWIACYMCELFSYLESVHFLLISAGWFQKQITK